jgi:hypothetical protein
VVLVNNLSALKQRLIDKIPVALGVAQYQTVMLVHNVSYTFTAKVTEPSPSMLLNFLGLGVTINSDTRLVAGIPLTVPEVALRYGQYTLADGSKGESKYTVTTATIDRSVLVMLFRSRT